MILYDQKISITETLLERAQIPKAFWSLKVSGFRDEETQEKMRTLLSTMPDWLLTNQGILIAGAFCTGKTAFACMALRKALSFSADCLFAYSADVATRWHQDWKERGNTYYDEYRRVDLLVLDDAGQEGALVKHEATSRIEFLIRTRYDSNKPTILTTNLSQQDLLGRVSGAFQSVIMRAFPKVLVLRDSFLNGRGCNGH